MNEKEIRRIVKKWFREIWFLGRENAKYGGYDIEKAVSQLSNHSDKNTEAYCENLQRENDYLKEQLSRQDEVVAEGELNYINRGYTVICFGFNNKYKTCNNIEKYNGKNIIISIKEVE